MKKERKKRKENKYEVKMFLWFDIQEYIIFYYADIGIIIKEHMDNPTTKLIRSGSIGALGIFDPVVFKRCSLSNNQIVIIMAFIIW
jgi:hypothetical protein